MAIPGVKKASDNMLVTQSNQLVEAKYHLSLYEQRLVLMLISLVEPDDEDFKNYKIKVSDFKNLVGLNTKNLYPKVKELLKSLATKVIEIPKEGNNYLITGWISDAEYFDNEGLVVLSFSKKLKPYLIALKSEFTSHKLGVAIRFKGVYTIRIYTLLKQYQRVGERTIKLDDFRDILGIEDGKLALFSNLKARTILQAKKEFSGKNEDGSFCSDINFDFELIKTGRKITAIKFIIIKQENTSVKFKEVPQIILDYEFYGVMRDFTTPFLKERSEEMLRNTLEYFKQELLTKEVENQGAYLAKLLERNAGQEIEAIKQKKKNKEIERAEALRKEEERKKKELLEKAEAKHLNNVKSAYLGFMSSKQKEDLFKQLKSSYEQDFGENNEIKALDSGFLSKYLNDIVRGLPQYLDDYDEMIKGIINEIK